MVSFIYTVERQICSTLYIMQMERRTRRFHYRTVSTELGRRNVSKFIHDHLNMKHLKANFNIRPWLCIGLLSSGNTKVEISRAVCIRSFFHVFAIFFTIFYQLYTMLIKLQ